jgi:hypothetical protein
MTGRVCSQFTILLRIQVGDGDSGASNQTSTLIGNGS